MHSLPTQGSLKHMTHLQVQQANELVRPLAYCRILRVIDFEAPKYVLKIDLYASHLQIFIGCYE